MKKFNRSIIVIIAVLLVNLSAKAQQYPFSLSNTITASLNVETANTELFNNKIIGYNIEGFNTTAEKNFIKLVDPVTIRFPHGVWANFYEWQTDGYQQDSYDNLGLQANLDVFVDRIKGHINGIADLNDDKKVATGGKGYDMMWTYSINFDDGASSVARAKKDIALGLEVKSIELGNEHFWPNQRSNRTETPAMYLAAATEVSKALKAEFPDIELSIPLGWRRNQADYNNEIKADGSYFDAITIHKYVGADPDIPGESNNAYSNLLTAKLELAEDVNWVRDNFAPGKPVWLTEWGVSASEGIEKEHAAACLGMADVYMYMAENQHIFHRANWFSFNRILNSMVLVDAQRRLISPLQKKPNLSTYEIIQDVFRDATMMKGTVTASENLTVDRGSIKVINARATVKNGETKVMVVNLSNKPVVFDLKFDNVTYSKAFTHEALIFENLGPVDPVDYFSNQLQLIKQGTGSITLPPLSVSKISGIYLNSTAHPIAGVIEAEAYKPGGQGIGFSDTTSDNTLSAGADTDGVDVGTSNGVTFVGDTQNGEWLKYDVNVLNTENYDFEFVYAAANSNGVISVEIDNQIIFNNFVLPQTGSNTNFQTIKKLNVRLIKGLHELKINVLNAGFYLDKVNMTLLLPLKAPIFLTPDNLTNILPGKNIEIEGYSYLADANITKMELFLNNVLVRSIANAPFKWGFDGQNDVLLENIKEGTYQLKLVLTDNLNRTAETSITVTSEGFPTAPYLNSPHVIPGIIQFEDYDTQTSPGASFSDSTTGNSGGVYRTDDVDIIADGTGFVVNTLAGGEYLRYSIDVTETNTYQMLVNYRTNSSNSKPFAAYVLSRDLTSRNELFSAPNGSTTAGIRRITDGSIYQDYTSPEFNLEKGLWILELNIPNGGAGPNYDYVTLKKSSNLSTSDFSKIEDLIIYPIPSNNGKFTLNKSKKWEVYSILGKKIAQGNGNLVDISNNSKGLYILKTSEGELKKLIFN